MKKLLLILALMLMPLSVADACPGRGGLQGEEAPLVTLDDLVAETLSAMQGFAESAYHRVNQLGPMAAQLMTEVQFNIEDTKVVAAVDQTFQAGSLMYQLAQENLNKGSELAALAELEEGPDAAALRLQAAAEFAKGGSKLLRSATYLLKSITLAEEALEDVKEDGPTA